MPPVAYRFSADPGKGELLGRTEYGNTVAIALFATEQPGCYELTLTLDGGQPRRYTFLAKDSDFLGNKVQLKGPFLRIVLDSETARKFQAFLQGE